MGFVSWLKGAVIALSIFLLAEPCFSKLVITTIDDQFLPGDSIAALAISLAQGAENVHLSLVMTADDRVVVLRDSDLNDFTNVSELFPGKMREDGSFHVLDFTLEELKTLSLINQNHLLSTATSFPTPEIPIATLEQALGLIKTMESSLNTSIGVVAEVKKSWQFLHEEKDISSNVISIFKDYGYVNTDDRLILASYDPEELQRIHDTLLPAAGIDAQLLQLTEENSGQQTKRLERNRWIPYNYEWLFTKFGLKAVSGYADFIGISPSFLQDMNGDLLHQEYVEDVHILGMKLLVYHAGMRETSHPDLSSSFHLLLETLLFTAGADGFITSDDVLVREFFQKRSSTNQSGKKTTIELLLENVKKQQTN